jgi:hypothetical protein
MCRVVSEAYEIGTQQSGEAILLPSELIFTFYADPNDEIVLSIEFM